MQKTPFELHSIMQVYLQTATILSKWFLELTVFFYSSCYSFRIEFFPSLFFNSSCYSFRIDLFASFSVDLPKTKYFGQLMWSEVAISEVLSNGCSSIVGKILKGHCEGAHFFIELKAVY